MKWWYILLLLYPPVSVQVSRAIDGDTLDTSLGRMRVLGVNAPERGQRCWREARDFWANVSELRLERDFVNRDRYGRLLRWTGLERELVGRGLAKAYCIFPNYRYCRELYRAQADAMQEGKGCLWRRVESCLEIDEVSRKGEWVTVRNGCNSTVSMEGHYVESDGRQRELLHGRLCPGCTYTVSLKLGRYALLFSGNGFIGFAS